MTTELIGYTDRFSAAPGETIRFMVSTDLPGYETTLVRLIHGDVNAEGPGFKEEPVDAHINGRRSGRKQYARSGSYVLVDDHASLSRLNSFTLQAWIYPTTPDKGEAQGVLSKWSTEGTGFSLAVGTEGALELWLGGPGADSGARVSTGQALAGRRMVFRRGRVRCRGADAAIASTAVVELAVGQFSGRHRKESRCTVFSQQQLPGGDGRYRRWWGEFGPVRGAGAL